MYKNKIYFSEDLHYSNFIKRYKNNYTANKQHTKHNFLYFLKTYNLMHIVDKVKKKNLDDLADSFMQIISFIKYKKNI